MPLGRCRPVGELQGQLHHCPGQMGRGRQGDNGAGHNEDTSGAGEDGEGKAPPWKRHNENTSGAGEDGEGKAPPWKRRRLS